MTCCSRSLRWGGGSNVDPETALRKATARFGERFERIKEAAERDGVDLEKLSDEELLGRYLASG